MRKAFTLVELMISIILLSLIVSFLYQSVAQLQSSNQQFIKHTDSIQKREEVLKLLYNDFINANTIDWSEKERDLDVIAMQSSHTLHAMTQPYLTYKVYRDENTLRRIESPLEKLDVINNLFRFDEIIKDVKLFKVYEQKGHYLIYLQTEGMDDIYLDIIPPALKTAKTAEHDSNTSQDRNSSVGSQSEDNTTVEG